jgi:hypothetical protein
MIKPLSDMETNLQGKSTESNFHEFKKKNLRRREGKIRRIRERIGGDAKEQEQLRQPLLIFILSPSLTANFASQSKQIS